MIFLQFFLCWLFVYSVDFTPNSIHLHRFYASLPTLATYQIHLDELAVIIPNSVAGHNTSHAMFCAGTSKTETGKEKSTLFLVSLFGAILSAQICHQLLLQQLVQPLHLHFHCSVKWIHCQQELPQSVSPSLPWCALILLIMPSIYTLHRAIP